MAPKKDSPSLPLKTRLSVHFIRTISDLSCRRDGTVNRRIFRFFDHLGAKVPPNSTPRNGVMTADVSVDAGRGLWFRLFVPTRDFTGGEKAPLVVFFHGGGFVFLSPDDKGYDTVCRRFARKFSAVVVSVNYRLAPEHRCPAQYDDGFDVLKFLDNNLILPPFTDLSKCFLAGDSAGGNLAHHVAVRVCHSNLTNIKVIGLIAIQPFFGGEERTKAEIELAKVDLLISEKRTNWLWKAFLPPEEGIDREHPSINVTGPRAEDISGLDFPATMVVIAGFDSLKDWQRRYYDWLKNSGKEVYLVEYPKMIHAFYVFPELPESTQLISEAHLFIQKQVVIASNKIFIQTL